MREQTEPWNLDYWQHDADSVAIVCATCGARGQLMSRYWNWDEKGECWEPMKRHIPACEHLKHERDAAE